MSKLPRTELQSLLQDASDAPQHDLCVTCELFHTYLAHLRMDSESADKDLFAPFKVPREEMHKTLFCKPCPPGELYTAFMLKKKAEART